MRFLPNKIKICSALKLHYDPYCNGKANYSQGSTETLFFLVEAKTDSLTAEDEEEEETEEHEDNSEEGDDETIKHIPDQDERKKHRKHKRRRKR